MPTGKLWRLILLVVLIPACNRGPETGALSGSITLDNKPVPEGIIRFVPDDRKLQPNDARIENGTYTIKMPLGPAKVEIYWLKSDGKVEDTSTQGTSVTTQMIPAKYNTKTTLKHTFEKGQNTRDFKLDSK